MGAWIAPLAVVVEWGLLSLALPAEGRWRRAGGVALSALFAGVTMWLLAFSAGAAVLIGSGGDYMPLGSIATWAGSLVAGAFVVPATLLARKDMRK